MQFSEEIFSKVQKHDLINSNNLIDYFLVVGLNTNSIFSDFLYENDIKVLNSSDDLRPEFVSIFPPIEKLDFILDDTIIQSCFPSGFKIMEGSQIPNQENFFFSLDNPSFTDNYRTRRHFACIKFYESLENYDKLRKKVNEEINSEIFHETNQQENTFNYSNKDETKSMRNFKKINENDNASQTNLRSTYIQSQNSITIKKFVPKCILIASLHPYYETYFRILRNLINFTKNKKIKKPIEKLIEMIVLDTPAPQRGIYKLEVSLINEIYEIFPSTANKLPIPCFELEELFKFFGYESIVEIFKHILLETPILVFSSKIQNLSPVIEGMLFLLFPLKFSNPYIDILPNENFSFIESNYGYIYGINQKYSKDFFNRNKIEIQNKNLLIVNLDDRKTEFIKKNFVKENTVQLNFIGPKQLKVIDLPRHYKEKLIEDLNVYSRDLAESQKKEEKSLFLKNIRTSFFKFMVNILQNYSSHINLNYFLQKEKSGLGIGSIFKIADFLQSVETDDLNFYNEFIHTNTFFKFIYQKIYPSSLNEKLENIFFDEHIVLKNNRKLISTKKDTPFLNFKSFAFKKVHKVISESSNYPENFTINQNLQKQLLKKGQEIILEGNEILFNYYFFPSLSFETFSTNNKKKIENENPKKEFEFMSQEIIRNSGYLNFENENEIENSVYVCWLILFTMTFHYNKAEEKRYRFYEMLEVLNKMKFHEIENFHLIFKCLSIYGESFMIFKLYEKMIGFGVNPTFYIRTLILQTLKKLDQEKNVEDLKNIEEYDFSNAIFKKRSFQNLNDTDINFTNNVSFYSFDKCSECSRKIKLEKVCLNFKDMRKEIEWLKCPNCFNFILPKLGIKIEIEYNNKQYIYYEEKFSKVKTANFEKIILYSPYYLKKHFTISLLKEFKFKLNLEILMNNFNAVFWNSIWYFTLFGLPFDFLLPYETPFTSAVCSNYRLTIENSITVKMSNKNPTSLNTHKSQKSDLPKISLENDKNLRLNLIYRSPVKQSHLKISSFLNTPEKYTSVASPQHNYINTNLLQDINKGQEYGNLLSESDNENTGNNSDIEKHPFKHHNRKEYVYSLYNQENFIKSNKNFGSGIHKSSNAVNEGDFIHRKKEKARTSLMNNSYEEESNFVIEKKPSFEEKNLK